MAHISGDAEPGRGAGPAASESCVLLVGDEPFELRQLEEMLRPLGCLIERADTSDDAAAQLAQRGFAAVLMDAALPPLPLGNAPLLLLCDPGLKPSQVLRAHQQAASVDCLFRPLVAELLRARVSVLVELERKSRQVVRLVERERAAVELHRSIFEEQSVRLLGEASARNLRTLGEALPQQVWSSDPSGALVFVNSAVLRYFDRNSSEVLGDGWLDVLHPNDVERCLAAWTHSLQTGEEYQIEFRLRRADGVYRWHLGRARASRGLEGRIVRWIGTNTDIDDQIRARERIEESERSFRALAQTIPQMCFAATPEGAIDYYNQQWIDYTGVSPPPSAPREAWRDVLDLSSYPLALQRWNESLASGAPFEMEMPILRAEDKTYRLHLTRAVPLRNPEGAITRWFGTCTDIHEQRQQMFKRLEWEARERQLRHVALRAEVGQALTQNLALTGMLNNCCQALVDHLGASVAGVWTLSANEPVLELQASAGEHESLSLEQSRVLIGQQEIGLIAQDQKPIYKNDVSRDLKLAGHTESKPGSLVAFAGYPLIASGKLVGVLAMFAQRTLDMETLGAIASVAEVIAQGISRKRIEEELELRAQELARSNAELERFCYIASHDLQEPLRMVASYTQLLGKRYRGRLDKDADEFIGFAIDGAQRMQTLINDLLTLSSVGTKPGAMVEVPLQASLDAALSNLRQAIADKKVQITQDPLPTVLAYDRQLIQLFQNLIGNAIKFGDAESPRVHIGAARLEGEWRFSVRDNGIGIDPTFYPRLFVVFQRLHSRAEYPGNGVGLAICKKIVDRHGGKIWIESKPGEGSTFYFTLRGGTA